MGLGYGELIKLANNGYPLIPFHYPIDILGFLLFSLILKTPLVSTHVGFSDAVDR